LNRKILKELIAEFTKDVKEKDELAKRTREVISISEGIEGEIIRRKAGKKAATAAT